MKKCVWICSVWLVSVAAPAQPKNILVSELLPDPEPALALPPAEFVELFNAGPDTVDLSGWTLSCGRSQGRFPDSIFLAPFQYLVCCSKTAAPAFAGFGQVAALSGFPALSNTGDTIFLKDNAGLLQQALPYRMDWYGDMPPDGRSLELPDPGKACSPLLALVPSIHPSGGTPGKPNSHQQATWPPAEGFLHAYCLSPQTIMVVADDRIGLEGSIRCSPGRGLISYRTEGVFGNRLLLELEQALEPGVNYSLQLEGFGPCGGREAWAKLSLPLALPTAGATGASINEILCNPAPGGSDYLEITNIGNRVIDLNGLQLANRNAAGVISSIRRVIDEPRYLFPGNYLVFTTRKSWLVAHYLARAPQQIVEVSSLPSWPDAAGTAVLLDSSGQVLDEVSYSEKWHHPLLRLKEGVALEKTQPNASSADAGSWTSAASHAGYGTPGYANSVWMDEAGGQGWALEWIAPEWVLRFEFPQAGWLLTLYLYSWEGRKVKTIVQNGICGKTGHWRWNGRDDLGRVLPAGPYLLMAEAFSLEGRRLRYRRALALNGKE